jgi:peptide/nickel transport system substrate-binding protein
MSRRFIVAASALLLALGVSACSASSSNGGSGGGGGSSSTLLRVGTLNKFEQTNPFNAFNFTDYFVQQMEYPYLIQYDSQGKIIPDYATSWSTSPDGKTWTFHLVPNAKWSDGKPLTSADVAFTLNTIIKYQTGATALDEAYVTGMKNATAPDPNTVVLHYTGPVATVLAYLDQVPIVPQHSWQKYAGGNGAGMKSFPNSGPIVAGGPFILESLNGSNFALFKENPNFYGPKPKFSEFGLQYYATADSMIQALKAGQLDYAQFLPQADAATVKADGLDVNSYPGLNVYFLYINSGSHLAHPEIGNPLVKKAMAHALDRNRMVQSAYPGSAPGASIVPPANGDWVNSALKPETFDLSLANRLLDQAGYQKGPNGIRIANGHPMSYTILFASDLTGPGDRVFQIMQQDFKQIGISISQKTLDASAFGPAIYGSNNHYNGWDLAMEGIGGILDPGFAVGYFDCANLGGWNFSGWCDKTYQSIFDKQNQATNLAKRHQLVNQLQTMAYNARPAIVLFYSETIDVHSKQWTGFGSDPYGAFNSLSKVTFTQAHHV